MSMTKIITLFCVLAVLAAFVLLVMNARNSVGSPEPTTPNEPARFGSPL